MKKRFIPHYAQSKAVCLHLITRVVDRNFVLQRKEREKMIEIIRNYEFFCGVKVLSYCIMTNHLHLLVEVPPKKKGASVEVSDDELLARLKRLYSPEAYRDAKWMLEHLREEKSQAAAEEFKAKFTCRMHDVSEFMKGVKQNFSRWFNRTHNRVGTLWESRFKSVVVEDGFALRIMSAYIDLNPVRAGMVEKPEDYKWSSYGEAMLPVAKGKAAKGRALARAGICRVLQKNRRMGGRLKESDAYESWDEGVSERYRMMLFADGEEVFEDGYAVESGDAAATVAPKFVRKGFSRKDVEKVLENGGKLTFGEAMRCRVRYMSDGVAVGSREFVDGLFEKSRELFGPKRKTGARIIREVRWKKKRSRLYTFRQLKKDALE